jgi:hypothetical protein
MSPKHGLKFVLVAAVLAITLSGTTANTQSTALPNPDRVACC